MRVALFVGSIIPTDGGGYTYVQNLISAIASLQDESPHEFVICHHSVPELASQFPSLRNLDLNQQKVSVLSRRESMFQALPVSVDTVFKRLFRIPAGEKWDERVYRRHGIQFLVKLVPWSEATLEIPFAAVLWDLQHRTNPWFPEISARGEWSYREANYSLMLRRASLVYTGTEVGKQEIVSYYQVPGRRIKVLPFPTPEFAVANSRSNHQSTLALGIDLPKDYLFYPAQFWPHKNQIVILEACKQVRDETGWDLGVVFVGADKGNGDYLKQQTERLGLGASVKFLGFVPENELVQLYRNAFCLVYATFCGPDNLPPLEALALDCPVIASHVPGSKEQLGDAVLLFDPQDETDLKKCILRLRDVELRSRLIAAGRVRAASRTWNDYARDLVATLDAFQQIRRAWA